MALVSKTYTFSAGTTIVASEHNTNYDTLYNLVNGNIDNANIKASAGIVDSKIAQISTAGKVSGAALTSLGSIPTGGGTIPAKNGGTGGDLSAADQGAIPYFSATGVSSALAAGTSGYVLKTQGAGANPVWAIAGFGSPATRVASTIYQAATDGLLIGSTHTDDSAYYEIRTDSASTPTTVLMKMGGTGSTTTDVFCPFCCPIKKNDYYRIIAQGSGDVQALDYCFFVPMGS